MTAALFRDEPMLHRDGPTGVCGDLVLHPREFRFTREGYHRAADAGVFGPARVELIRGRVIEMAAIGTDHGKSVMKCGRAFRRIFDEAHFTVRPALPFVAAGESEPEPDYCVVAGLPEDIPGHPRSCLLLIEISQSTLAYDRTEKAELYAESGVADYWIVNLVDRVVEVHREPHRNAEGRWAYASVTALPPTATIAPLAAADAPPIPVAELLP